MEIRGWFPSARAFSPIPLNFDIAPACYTDEKPASKIPRNFPKWNYSRPMTPKKYFCSILYTWFYSRDWIIQIKEKQDVVDLWLYVIPSFPGKLYARKLFCNFWHPREHNYANGSKNEKKEWNMRKQFTSFFLWIAGIFLYHYSY